MNKNYFNKKSENMYGEITSRELLSHKPIPRKSSYPNKEDIELQVSQLRAKWVKAHERLQELMSFDFPGRVETNEMQRLRGTLAAIEEDLKFLKNKKAPIETKKRGRKPLRRKAKRSGGD